MTPEALAQTHLAAFPKGGHWSPEAFAKLMSQKGMILAGDAKSFVLARVILDEAEVLTVATHPDFRGQGRAKAVMEEFLRNALSRGVSRVFLEVAEDNIPAKALYLGLNFSPSGRRAGYYARAGGKKIDAILMETHLSSKDSENF